MSVVNSDKFSPPEEDDYQTRSQVFIKIIRARNLMAKDSNGFSDPYVKVTMGLSSVRTTTRKMNLNPDWGMVFPFDWDRSMRFAKIEVWDEDDISADDFLGSVLIPLYSLREGMSSVKWYPLGRRSNKSHVSGLKKNIIFEL
jgi:Ca2+-dependent lipid-binding protein